MDMKALETDVEKAVKLIPPQLVIDLLTVVATYFHILPGLVPLLVPLLQPHVMAGVLETQTGLLTTQEIVGALSPVIQRFLQAHPDKLAELMPVIQKLMGGVNANP